LSCCNHLLRLQLPPVPAGRRTACSAKMASVCTLLQAGTHCTADRLSCHCIKIFVVLCCPAGPRTACPSACTLMQAARLTSASTLSTIS
jgi:hypothetical protein